MWLKKLDNSLNFHLNVEALHWKNAVPDSYSIAFPEKIIQVLELLKRDILIVFPSKSLVSVSLNQPDFMQIRHNHLQKNLPD